MLTAILDTSVLVSSVLVHEGIPARVYRAWTEQRYLLVTSAPQLDELAHTLSYERIRKKYQLTDEILDQLFNVLRRDATWVRGTTDPGTPVRDPNDVFVLSMAAESEADVIVSSDKDLLVLGSYRDTRILTPRQFFDLLGLD